MAYRLVYQESIITTDAPLAMRDYLFRRLARARTILETYVLLHPEFRSSLVPLTVPSSAHPLIKKMAKVAVFADVGPFAAVAGAIADYLIEGLIRKGYSNVYIENGGDIALVAEKKKHVSIYAGNSPLSQRLILSVEGRVGICTSSATVGPSISFGDMDAATVIASDAACADACATALGNCRTLDEALVRARTLPIIGAILVQREKCVIVANDGTRMPSIRIAPPTRKN